MLALHILELKSFMNQLLCSDTFDHFLLKEAVIQKEATWKFDGTIAANFDAGETQTADFSNLSFLPYAMVRRHCFDLIKGKYTPACFKFVFLLSPEQLSDTLSQLHTPFSLSDVTGMFFNLNYQNGSLLLTTGISYRIFSTDKSLEREWDCLMEQFLKSHNIVFENLG